MFEIVGKYGTAVVYAEELEESATAQIYALLNHPIALDANIRIMPDCHAGSGCVIGYTAKLTDKVVPNLIGVDIGCGVLTFNLGKVSEELINLEKWHGHIVRGIPHGMNVRAKPYNHLENIFELFSNTAYAFPFSYGVLINEIGEICRKIDVDYERVILSLGTLGGGNHFIELGKDDNGNIWQTFHSGSRNFGKRVCEYHQKKAIEKCGKMGGLEYLEGDDLNEYCEDLRIAQYYAKLNRYVMAYEMLHYYFDVRIQDSHMVESIHNYIHFGDGIIRKGAIRTRHVNEEVVIPFNMRDGMIIGKGKGNIDWNWSAPHGSGRTKSRSKAKEEISLEDFEKTMADAGVQSLCINRGTLDESPMAYKDTDTAIRLLEETVEITNRVIPIFSFKSEEKDRKDRKNAKLG